MSERIFCIDFGSSYTKVGLRRGRWTNSELVRDQKLQHDELKVCVPSTVVVDCGQTPQRFTFGEATLGRRPGGVIRVFSNWKSSFFSDASRPVRPLITSQAGTPTPTSSGLIGLFSSVEFDKLARQYGVFPQDIHSLRRMVWHAAALGRGSVPPSRSHESNSNPQLSSEPFIIAVRFFRYLRETVIGACKYLKPEVPSPEKIPARITVPAFGPESELPDQPAYRWLSDALRMAGWEQCSNRPIISEPYANAIGVLTRGSNCTRATDMFQKGLLPTHLAKGKGHPEPDYRAGVIDVGAYTVDFATLTHRYHGTQTLDELRFEHASRSVRHGITELDRAVLAVLPAGDSLYLANEASPEEWIRFRSRVYGEEQPMPHPDGGEIAAGLDGERVRTALHEYVSTLEHHTADFFGGMDDVPFKELILTGGGCFIPAIQNALILGAERGSQSFRKLHLPRLHFPGRHRQINPLQVVNNLDGVNVRGATALGGTSEYFEINRS